MTFVPNRVDPNLKAARAEILAIVAEYPGSTTAQIAKLRGRDKQMTKNTLISMMLAGQITKNEEGWIVCPKP